MQRFVYERAQSLGDATSAAAVPGTMLVAGGTEVLNWMKEGIAAPHRLVDVNGVSGLGAIATDAKGLRIGALARMSDVAAHEVVRKEYPAIAQALLKSASVQIRNMASIAGNLMQRTRCPYFRAEVELPCNKRRPGSGCSAMDGDDRSAALFGWSEACIATHPSDLAVALAALDAEIEVRGPNGTRSIASESFHRVPGDVPNRETALARGEVITAIVVAASATARHSHYVKVRERASYEFALVSAAACVDLANGKIRAARLALGGVAAKPWRLRDIEGVLEGASIHDAATLYAALGTAFAEARPRPHNGFKIELARRAAVRALQGAGGVE
jgi:xanthine dehydrogenase YagS FAD-binding subunit